MSSHRWAIKSRRLFDGTRKPAIQDAMVVIEDERITAVGPQSQVALPPDTEVLDVGDGTVLPGLIDAHVHMLNTGSVASGQESRAMNENQAMLMGARNAFMALKSGLTTVRDCGDRNYITSTAGQLWWSGIECDNEDQLRHAVRTLVKNGVDFIKLMGSGGNATPGSNPELSQYSEAEYRAVAEDAHRLGKKVAVHVHGVGSIRMAVDAGMDTLEHCPFRANGTIEYDEQLAEDIARKGLIVSIAMPATWYRLRAEDMRDVRNHPGHLWESRPETIRQMHKAGVKLVVSSDQGSTGTRIEELGLLMEFLVNKVGIPAVDVLYGATGLAAEALGIEDSVGVLEPGKIADIAIVDGDPLANIMAIQRVHTVVRNGAVVVSNGGIVVPTTMS